MRAMAPAMARLSSSASAVSSTSSLEPNFFAKSDPAAIGGADFGFDSRKRSGGTVLSSGLAHSRLQPERPTTARQSDEETHVRIGLDRARTAAARLFLPARCRSRLHLSA